MSDSKIARSVSPSLSAITGKGRSTSSSMTPMHRERMKLVVSLSAMCRSPGDGPWNGGANRQLATDATSSENFSRSMFPPETMTTIGP